MKCDKFREIGESSKEIFLPHTDMESEEMLGCVVKIEKKELYFGACDCLEKEETVYFYRVSVECSHNKPS